jgi:4,5-dihydroxyphthalate decarboxylase
MRIVLGDYPYAQGIRTEIIKPLYPAFARMVRDLEFDVCEMALATYLQAREAGVPITLLPVVMIGGTHHGSLTRLPESPELAPGQLKGKRVGVRSYSQTTGLWVRGILREEYGVEASDVTWVTTEEPHVASYESPAYVERSGAETVADLVRSRSVDAAVLGPKAIGGQGAGLVPVIPDAQAAAEAWIKRHGTVPVNHMVVIRNEVLDAAPAVYRELKAAIEATKPAPPVAAGWSDELAAALRIAGRYAFEQELVSVPADVDALEHEAMAAIS